MKEHWDKLDFEPRSSQRGVESNARIVEWSDGTKSLAIGDTFFDLNFSSVKNTILTFHSDDIDLMKCTLDQKAILKAMKLDKK